MIITNEKTEVIIGTSYEVMNELGAGFLESVYHHSLIIALLEKGFKVQSEVLMPVSFRGHSVGNFKADIIVDSQIIIEVKCVEKLSVTHKAQIVNYLVTFDLETGLLINFGNPRVEIARLYHPRCEKDLD